MMVSFVLILVAIILLGESIGERIFCPMSNSYNYPGDILHKYPIEIYYPIGTHINISTNPCKATHWDELKTVNCPIKSAFCPLDEYMIQRAVAVSGVDEDFENLKYGMSTNQSMNFIILGGSLPKGEGSEGCFSKLGRHDQPRFACRWGDLAFNWLQQSASKVKPWNFGRGGWTSTIAAEDIFEWLNSGGIKITAHDIIFLDYSVNDGFIFRGGNENNMRVFTTGFEHMVRKILAIYHRLSFRPTLIIMEHLPIIWGSLNSSDAFNYGELVYRPLARHYNISVWSHFDTQILRTEDNPLKNEHLRFQHHRHRHPAWHVHVFYADLVTALLQHRMENVAIKPRSSVPALPPVLYHLDKQWCNLEKSVVELNAMSSLSVVGTRNDTDYSVQAWRSFEDRVGKPGWIVEADADQGISSIAFMLPRFTHIEMVKFSHRISVTYLHTYENGGMISIYICGQFVRRLDSLWPPWFASNVSSADTEYIHTTVGDRFASACDAGLEQGISPNITATFRFEQYKDRPQKRLHQKFKITGVRICRTD